MSEIPNFLSTDLCAEQIKQAEALGFASAPITSETGTQVVSEIRNNTRVIRDLPTLSAQLWQDARNLVPRNFKGRDAAGLNDRFRLYRYQPGQFFDWHQDGSYRAADGQESQFTLLIYLNQGFEGGGTRFADVFSSHVFSDFTIAPEPGKALLFHHPISHRGDPVLSGTKYVLRTDVMYHPATSGCR
ncbi:2OG-Fe(II) oxygenase [Roseobacter sp. SK209-2-6]|uniref:2OG-Fe(II) oxygenase n=1 Tax=Roseobacter sp. SK209-2-6 TaxID=388739 RepID=UPI0002FECE17|nr:2OG-Fe(II) oxygenase [Roseobacter sp. SK209-2-6]